jgi:NADPH-dependent glutamate synthase beta subunit-like oxidoreductase
MCVGRLKSFSSLLAGSRGLTFTFVNFYIRDHMNLLEDFALKTEEKLIPKELQEKLLDAEKLKYCFECGICTASCPMTELAPSHYNPRILLETIFLYPEKALTKPSIWLCGWCYRCFKRCPQKLKLPEILLYVKTLAVEKGYIEGLEEAADIIGKTIPLAESCYYVCFHPERTKISKEKFESVLKKVIKSRGKVRRQNPSESRDQKVAIIGSGPAGLTAAYELARKGYRVTVFEASPEAGGMLRYGIPEQRLPRKAVDDDIKYIKGFGVEIKTKSTLDKDITIDQLQAEGYKAIFIAVGALKSRKIGCEGEELQGALCALDFLREIKSGKKVKVGEKVAVIGGGNVAVDAARTALHEEAKEVTILYRRTRDEMPANPWEVKEAEEEGIKIEFLIAPTKILGKDGKVAGLELIKMRLGEPDETGRRAPIPIEDSKFTREFDTVILAVGEAVDTSFLPKDIELSDINTIWADAITTATTMEGVFAGGDAVTGPASVMEAIIAGKRAAESIDQYIRGE